MTARRRKAAGKGARRPSRARSRKTAHRTTPATTAGLADLALETGRSMWLAGLGLALTTVETADEAFETLVARGKAREPRTIAAAEKLVRDARRTVDGLASDAARECQTWMGIVPRLARYSSVSTSSATK